MAYVNNLHLAYGQLMCHYIPKTHNLLLHLNPDQFYLSGTDLLGCPGKEAVKWV